jgi:hypothetical protein
MVYFIVKIYAQKSLELDYNCVDNIDAHGKVIDIITLEETEHDDLSNNSNVFNCGSLCDLDNTCTFFVFMYENKSMGQCWLKSDYMFGQYIEEQNIIFCMKNTNNNASFSQAISFR